MTLLCSTGLKSCATGVMDVAPVEQNLSSAHHLRSPGPDENRPDDVAGGVAAAPVGRNASLEVGHRVLADHIPIALGGRLRPEEIPEGGQRHRNVDFERRR